MDRRWIDSWRGRAVARKRKPMIELSDGPADRRDVRDAPETSVSADGLSK